MFIDQTTLCYTDFTGHFLGVKVIAHCGEICGGFGNKKRPEKQPVGRG